MRIAGYKFALTSTVAILATAVLLSAAPVPPAPHPQAAQSAPASHEIVLTFEPAQTKVHYMVDSTLHTVHGTFALKSGTLHFDPQTGKTDGAIVVNAASGESGNGSRDARMHKEILETWKFSEAKFRPTQIDGQVSLNSSCEFKVKGVLTLHGSDHDVVALVHSEFSGNQWKGTAKFDVPYIQWGIKDPSNLFLHVKPIVNIEMEITATQSPN